MKLNKPVLFAVLLLLLFSVSTFVVFTAFKDDPESVVKKYWQLVLDGQVDKASELKSDVRSISPVFSDGTSVAGNAVNLDGTIDESCCYVKEITEQKLKITKIIETKEEKSNALVAVEAEDKDQKTEIYVNCLAKRGGEWLLIDVSTDIYEDRNALCFDTGKRLRPKGFNK